MICSQWCRKPAPTPRKLRTSAILTSILGTPKFHITKPRTGWTIRRFFEKLCWDGLERRYGSDVPQSNKDRLTYEIGVVKSMGYTNYYLIVWDYINYAKSQGIPVGPGRGSGAGSIAAYCVGITDIDPIRYNLIFERFLNPERVSMPDFDVDFCYERRQEVIDYVNRKYGADHVAQIVTFGTMAARNAIRDVGRVMGMPYQSVDVVAKQVPMELKMTLKRALEVSPELKRMYDSDPQVTELIDTALKVEGMPRHASTHAAGVVITPEPTDYYLPLATNDGLPVTQFNMTEIEELGLLKMDFLGLRTPDGHPGRGGGHPEKKTRPSPSRNWIMTMQRLIRCWVRVKRRACSSSNPQV